MWPLHYNVIAPVPLETLGIKENYQIIKSFKPTPPEIILNTPLNSSSKRVQHHTNSSILQASNLIISNTLTYPLINNKSSETSSVLQKNNYVLSNIKNTNIPSIPTSNTKYSSTPINNTMINHNDNFSQKKSLLSRSTNNTFL